jgi:hypothetical protein
MSVKRIVTLAVSFVLLVIILFSAGSILENVPADEIVVIQSPVSGDLEWYITPGLKWQGFGKVTSYKKSFQYWFSANADQGKKDDQSIKIQFNEGGKGWISGSVRIDLPLDKDNLNKLHTKYGSQWAIEHELVRPTFERSIFMSGPLMSSTESFSERKNQLIGYIEDQAHYGVYQTTTSLSRVKDAITGVDKTVGIVNIVKDKDSPGGFARSEQSPFKEYGVRAYNLSINSIKYEDIVEKQIASQQAAVMAVQTAIAESRQAEQNAITAEQNGKAAAAKSKWAQEVEKAKAVVIAQQEYDVQVLNAERELKKAEFNKKQMEQYKEAELLRAEGDATYKKKVMEADGALAPKLEVYKAVMFEFAKEFGKQKWVPEVMMGSGDSSGGNGAMGLMEILGVKAAKDLALDMSMQGKVSAQQKK